MKTPVLLALVTFALAGCGGGALPAHPAMPITAVSDQADEWLYDNCQVRKVAKLDNEDVEPTAQAAGSNFVEVVYAEPGESDVVMFACKERLPSSL